MTHLMPSEADLKRPSIVLASPTCGNPPPSRTARAFDLHIKLVLLSAGGLVISGIASAAGVQSSITTPAAVLCVVGCAHLVVIASYVALYIAGDPHLWIGDASPTCHALLWLILTPYFGRMVFEVGRRFACLKSSKPAGSVLLPLCACSLMLTALIGATYAQTTLFNLRS